MRLLTMIALIASVNALSADWAYPTERKPAQVAARAPKPIPVREGACLFESATDQDNVKKMVAYIVLYETSNGDNYNPRMALLGRRAIRDGEGLACYNQLANGLLGRSPLTGE